MSRTSYPNFAYVHQGWLTDDQAVFYQDDELDAGNTRTLIWDVADLDNPFVANEYFAATTSRDHNLYVVGDRVYQANYTTGLRILDITDRLNPVEVAFFDTYTPNDGFSFNGAWSNYPFFASGVVVVSSIGEGLFVLQMPARTRYVAPMGDDMENNCSHLGSPCATIAHAVSQANDGDTLDIAAGVYLEPGLVIDKELNIQAAGVVVR